MNRSWGQAARLLGQVRRHRLDLLVPAAEIPHRGIRLALKVLDLISPAPRASRGERLRSAFIELGPVYIKLGQLLSTRRDLIPLDIADELIQLQDNVPPIADFDVPTYVSNALGAPLDDHFEHIEPEPLASASIAQVHGAQLRGGERVVIKLVRPDIEARIVADMAFLHDIAARLDRNLEVAKRLHLPRVMQDHETVLLQELNMHHEAENQQRLRRNFAESELLYVPRLHPQFTRKNMLVMERIQGIPINQIDALEAAGVDLRVLAHKGVETFFKQVFEHNFFHADMHPGNIFIDTTQPNNPKYIALDCAIIGSLTKEDQSYLAQNLIAFFHRDYASVANLHIESGWVPPETDPKEFERVIREVCEPIFAKPLAEISFAEFTIKLFETAGQFNMEMQPQLVLLQKTLLYIEGLGRQLYPQLDLWETAAPFMEEWAKARLGPTAVLSEWLAAGPQLWQQFAALPQTLHRSQSDLRLMKHQLAEQQRALASLHVTMSKGRRRRRFKQAAGVALVAGSMWMLYQPIASGLSGGDVTMLAGVVSAFLGSALLIRA